MDIPKKATHNYKAFTLIELLIVIAIIGILASIVLVSLSGARDKARYTAMKAEMREFTILLQRQFADTGSYAALQSGWDGSTAECNNSFSGTYATEARNICISVVAKLNTASTRFYTGTSAGTTTNFSVMARVPGNEGRVFCMGSSGRSSETAYGTWTAGGCYSNP